ncbi:hypothetical protein JYU34_019267 [Plutella xylostella]|uniref:Large ribosomal subunit protein bL35m n=1 Tax=Plutella xylostella TaxID=51655 RepID=A0ABQ7PWF5_PLUXY|nr:hypothetical protein JYU34_019267 [Plutella xylostella]
MFRRVIPVARAIWPITNSCLNTVRIISNEIRGYSTLKRTITAVPNNGVTTGLLSTNKQILDISQNLAPVPVRTVTKFSLKRGKRKTVKAALKRFFRLHWGGWIRPKVGRHKKIWKKSPPQQRRLRQHILCNGTQSVMLDKMVTKFWKKPKYYVEDPYEPYHTREEFHITRKKPLVRH